MPLFSKKSKSQESQGKAPKQSLAIALSVSRKKPKKMADGGSVKSEKRPMPDDVHDDVKDVSQNRGDKPAKSDSWTDNPSAAQAKKPKQVPLSKPKIIGSDAFSVRTRDEIDADDRRISSEAPDGYGKQPNKMYNEDGPDREGDEVPDMEDEHSNHRLIWRQLILQNLLNKNMKREDDNLEEPKGLESDDDMMSPPEDEYMSQKMADGGEVEDPDMEEAIDHAASIASAIMSKHKQERMDSGSEDEDPAERDMMAEGGQVDIDESAEEQPNDYYDRDDAALKENYDSDLDDVSQPKDSNEIGDDREEESEDEHDSSISGKIRSRMKNKSAITK